MKSYIITLAASILLFVTFTSAQTTSNEPPECKIKTIFHCPKGKADLENGLKKVDGVMSAVADLQTKVVSVKYDATKLNCEKINEAIENAGFRTELTPEGKKINRECNHSEGEKH